MAYSTKLMANWFTRTPLGSVHQGALRTNAWGGSEQAQPSAFVSMFAPVEASCSKI